MSGTFGSSEDIANGEALQIATKLLLMVHCICGASQISRGASFAQGSLDECLHVLDSESGCGKRKQSLEGSKRARKQFEGEARSAMIANVYIFWRE